MTIILKPRIKLKFDGKGKAIFARLKSSPNVITLLESNYKLVIISMQFKIRYLVSNVKLVQLMT